MTDTPDLTALLGSRLCHDLISPIGAIGNGVELLMMDAGASPSPELALIHDSVAQAKARIQLFRVAFGQAVPGQRIAPSEVQGILTDLGRAGRLTFLAPPLAEMERGRAKILFLGLLCLESALPWGGQVVITETPDAALSLVGQGHRVKPMPELWAMITGKASPTTLAPGEVHFALLGQALGGQGRVTHSETGVQLLL